MTVSHSQVILLGNGRSDKISIEFLWNRLDGLFECFPTLNEDIFKEK